MSKYINADIQEVKHGKWELSYIFGIEIAECSCCRKYFFADPATEAKEWNYCPNCGAKMDGDDNA
jgi:hypothetical protein